MPQGLVPVIISQLRLVAVVHKGTKDCPQYLRFIMMSTRCRVTIVTHLYTTFTNLSQIIY